jgi:hypothetical protein
MARKERFRGSWNIELSDEVLEHIPGYTKTWNNPRRRVFSDEEDRRLIELVVTKACTNWFDVAKKLGQRSPRQCRDRWVNYLCPTNNFQPWTSEEDQILIEKINEIGTRWTAISRLIPGRSDNCIKNRWYSSLRAMCSTDRRGKFYLKRENKRRQQVQCLENEVQLAKHIVVPAPPEIVPSLPDTRPSKSRFEQLFIPELEIEPEPFFEAIGEGSSDIDNNWDESLCSHLIGLDDPFSEAVLWSGYGTR